MTDEKHGYILGYCLYPCEHFDLLIGWLLAGEPHAQKPRECWWCGKKYSPEEITLPPVEAMIGLLERSSPEFIDAFKARCERMIRAADHPVCSVGRDFHRPMDADFGYPCKRQPIVLVVVADERAFWFCSFHLDRVVPRS